VNFVRQDVILEAVLKHHDGVEGNRTADKRRFGRLSNGHVVLKFLSSAL
jgi:hypothetical protein